MTILTLTLNPAIDHVLWVDHFQLGHTLRATSETRTPSGKGVGSSLVLHELGADTTAFGFAAGLTGSMLTALLDQAGIPHELLPASGETRIATLIVDQHSGLQSTVSAATLHVDEPGFTHLLDRLATASAWGIICAGSVPPGLPADAYATILRRLHATNLVTLLDTSGAALSAGVTGLPHVLKINADEARSLDGDLALSVASALDVRAALDQLRRYLGRWAREAIVVTLGRDGALAVRPDGGYRVHPLNVPVVSTAGAGDALNAGLMLALSRGESWSAALAWGTAAASSVVMNAGTAVCQRRQVEELYRQVTVEEIIFHD
ncbi:MAG: hexose kinase [Anaerolineae bacterium]|nr:hexose kinase [Anaerolineae bacterium]